MNLGDALAKFSGGLLLSAEHRVVDPPGRHAGHVRHSLAYFARPEDTGEMRALESDRIPSVNVGEMVTSSDWIRRITKGIRRETIRPGDWARHKGTERSKL